MDSLDGKVAIVTGGGSGIGEAVCRELARRGARVVIADIDEDAAKRVAAAIADGGGQATPSTVDVSQQQDITRLVQHTASAYGHLDYQFNNAGMAIGGDARDLTLGQWRRVLDVDLYGVLYGTLAAYPIMVNQGFGHIVNTSSAAGLLPQPLNTPYCTAKHAIMGLSLSLRLEGADLGVKVSAVCPGYVRTNIFETSVAVNLPHELATDTPKGIKMISPAQAAQEILDGVAHNKAVIAFPRYVRSAWRAYRLFPRVAGRVALAQVRKLRTYRATTTRKISKDTDEPPPQDPASNKPARRTGQSCDMRSHALSEYVEGGQRMLMT
jgi:NAD(P)-dependent dehydrogenase (short-subunit alcohol dehydrogenase family)